MIKGLNAVEREDPVISNESVSSRVEEVVTRLSAALMVVAGVGLSSPLPNDTDSGTMMFLPSPPP